MKKYLLLLIISFHTLCVVSQTNSDSNILLCDFKEVYGSNIPKVDDWPKDANGNMDCALMRVYLDGITHEDFKNEYRRFNFDVNTLAVDSRPVFENERHVVYVFVSPTDGSTFVNVSLEDFGKSKNIYVEKFEERHCYNVTLKNNKKVSISFSTEPANAIVRIESGEKITTPGTMPNVHVGSHRVTVTLDGRTLVTDTIDVTEENVSFEYDLRPKKKVVFESVPSGLELFIDDKIVGHTPITKNLAYGSYKIEARKNLSEIDVRTITVGEYSDSKVTLSPMQKKTIDVYATYKNSNVSATLYVNDELFSKSVSPNYRVTLQLDRKYQMEMLYNGKRKRRTVKAKRDMDDKLEFRISDRNPVVWPWQRVYDARPIGVSVGYVSKQWTVGKSGNDFKGALPWQAMGYDADGNTLHGIQAGLHLQPCFSWGGGLYSGLFLELYYSSEDAETNPDFQEGRDVFDRYMEFDIYVPVHLYYRIPFSEKVALSLHGGIGIDCGLYNSFYCSENDNIEPKEDFYGKDAFPERFSFSLEGGLGLRLGAFQINAQYSKGLSDNGYIVDDKGVKFETVQNKLSLGISYLIPGDY